MAVPSRYERLASHLLAERPRGHSSVLDELRWGEVTRGHHFTDAGGWNENEQHHFIEGFVSVSNNSFGWSELGLSYRRKL